MKRWIVALVLVVVVVSGAVGLWWWLGEGRPTPTGRGLPTAAAIAVLPTEAAVTLPPASTAAVSPTPDTLSAALDPAMTPDRHPARDPITVRFDRPMARDSARPPLTFDPAITARFSWNADATAVTFTPTTDLREATPYTVAVAPGLTAQDGSTFAAPPSWRLAVVAPPRLLNRAPMSGRAADRRPAFTLTFTEPMDAATTAAALSVNPTVPLDLTWNAAGDQLVIRPAGLLDPGVGYLFTLTETAADRDGIALGVINRFRFTPSPVITLVSGPTQAAPDAPLSLLFNYDMPATTARTLTVSPPLDGQWVLRDGRELVMDDPPLVGNVEYTITLGETSDAAGDPFPPVAPLTYHAPNPVAVTPGGTEAHTAAPLRLTFARPMSPEAVAAVTISPETAGDFVWEDERTLVFTPDGGHWSPTTRYTVIVSTAAADAAGRPILGRAATHLFRTGEERIVADWGIGPQTQVVDADGRRAVQFQSTVRESVAVGFDLLPLTAEGFLNRIVGDVTSSWEGPADPIPDDGLSPLASWTTQTIASGPDRYSNPQETIIPADAPPGLYLLRLNGGSRPANLLVALSRHTLVAKLAHEQITVWVSDIPDVADIPNVAEDAPAAANGVPGATVEVYARNGARLAEGATDERGVATMPLDAAAEPYVVIARAGDDVTFSALTEEMQVVGHYYDWGWWGEPPPPFRPPVFATHVQTDRPIYRPGQTVNYKAIVRLDDDGALSLPPTGTQVIMRLLDARDNVVRTQWLATDEFGAVYDSFALAEGAMLGQYAVEAQPVEPGGGAAETTAQPFQVEEYHKPDYSLTLDAPRDVVAGDTLTVTLSAEYLFGEPVAYAHVRLTPYIVEPSWSYYGGGPDEVWYPTEGEISGSTDAEGRLTLVVPTLDRPWDDSSWAYNAPEWQMGLEATVTDDSGRSVSSGQTITVHRAAESLTLDTGGFVVVAGQPFTVAAEVLTSDTGTPVAGRSLAVSLRGWSAASYEYSRILGDEEWLTGADGRVTFDYTAATPGYYRLRLSGEDAAGRPLRAEQYLYVVGDSSDLDAWYGSDSGDVGLAADRETYAPGDTATLAITTRFAGPALLTFERASVRRELPITLTPPLTRIELPILAEDAPNIHVTLNAWEPRLTTPPNPTDEEYWGVDTSQPDARLQQATVELLVPVTDRTLTVAISTDQPVYAPRDEAFVTVRVTNAAGQPVRAQVALAMVDEAIFLLRDDLTQPLYDAFYAPRPNRVLTRDALAPGRYLYTPGGMGGGGDAGVDAPRSDFPDTAQWHPALVTGANGEAHLIIPLPDSLTTWRLTARAVTAADTQVGEATATFTTHQDVIVRPIVPLMVTEGDTFTLSAVVHNYGAEAADLTVTLTGEAGNLIISEPAAQPITLLPGETRVVGWPVAAADPVVSSVLVTAESDGVRRDAVAVGLNVRPLAVPIHDFAVGDLIGAGDIRFDVPADALPASIVTFEVSPSPAGTLLNGLEMLTGFPYGCVEQTMSRALPNAVVSRAFAALNVPPPSTLDLDELVNESAQRLYGFQHEDGGWGWWFDDDSQAYQTAWVVFGLATMAEAGHEIDPGVIERGVTYLNDNLATADRRTRAYMLYSMAVAGQPHREATLALAENAYELDAFSLAALALSLDAAGRDGAAQTVLDQLAATAIVENGQAHWSGESQDGQYDSKVMASDVRATALALSAFVRLRPGSDLEPGIVRYLMSRRVGDGWGTTNETAYAIIGLTDHLVAAGIDAAPNAYTILLNGAPLAEGTLAPGELRDTLEIPFDQLQPGENVLTLSGAGGRLYYALNAHYVAARESIEAGGALIVTRAYLSAENRQPLESVQPGQLVRVRLTVQSRRPAFYMLIEDRLPAGLEPLNENLNTTSRVTDWGSYYEFHTGFMWRDYGYNYKEIRDGRVTFFVTDFGQGQRTFEYLARAVHSGTFIALPAEAWAMYEPALWGRSGSGELRVTSNE